MLITLIVSEGEKTELENAAKIFDGEYPGDDKENDGISRSMVVPSGTQNPDESTQCGVPHHKKMDDDWADLMHELANAIGIISMASEFIRREVNAIIALNPVVDPRSTMLLDLMETLEAGVDQANSLCERDRLRRKASSRPPARGEEAENAELKLEKLNLTEVLFAQIKLWRRVLRKELDIRPEIDSGVSISADKTLLTQVFTNVWLNAIQSMNTVANRANLMLVGCKCGDGMCRITIEDNGTGIKESDSDKIFKRGFTTKSTGNGIGLTVCRELCQAMGGAFDVRNGSRMGEGATVTIEFPVVDDEEREKTCTKRGWHQLDLDFGEPNKSG